MTAGGTEPFNYQWYYNTNTVMTNATGSTLIITNVQPAVAGRYSVTVSNLAGGITSSNAVLTINTNPVAPIFTSQPTSQVVLMGGTASFNAVAAGTAPITYQWDKNGVADSGRDFVHVDFGERASPLTPAVTRSPLQTVSAVWPAARPS